MIELAERAAYYGVSGPFQNYIQNAYKDPSGLPGALGLGQATATRLTNFFQFFCYVTPVFGLWPSFIFYARPKRTILTHCKRRCCRRLVARKSQDNHLLLRGLHVWSRHAFCDITANRYREWLYVRRLDNSYDIDWDVRTNLSVFAILLTFVQRHGRYQIERLATYCRTIYKHKTRNSGPCLR